MVAVRAFVCLYFCMYGTIFVPVSNDQLFMYPCVMVSVTIEPHNWIY